MIYFVLANKKYNQTKNKFEIILTDNSIVTECDDETIPFISYNFVEFSSLVLLAKDTIVGEWIRKL